MSNNAFVKLATGFTPHLHLIRKGSTAVVWLWCVLNQDEQGIVDADLDDIMAASQLGKATIVGAFDNLETASLIQPVPPRQKGRASYSLTGDFSRFGPGAPTGNGDFVKKVFAGVPKKLFCAPDGSCSSSDSESLTDLENQEKQLQLPLPARAEKTFFQAPLNPETRGNPPGNVFALYEQEAFGPLTPLVGETLGDWIDELGEERVREAIRQAVLHNVRTLAYVQAILKKWAEEKRRADPEPLSNGKTRHEVSGNDSDDRELLVPEPCPLHWVPLLFTDQNGQERDARETWQTARGELELQLPREAFDTWLRSARLIAHEGGTYIIGVSNIYAREWLEHRLKKVVVRTLGQVAGQSVEVNFVVTGPVSEPREPGDWMQAKESQ